MKQMRKKRKESTLWHLTWVVDFQISLFDMNSVALAASVEAVLQRSFGVFLQIAIHFVFLFQILYVLAAVLVMLAFFAFL